MKTPYIDPWFYRFLGLGMCMMACAILIVGAFPEVHTLNLLGLSDTTRTMVGILLGFVAWSCGMVVIALPQMGKKREGQ